jgi:hypothetical protein
MILRAADGTVYKVHFRHLYPTIKGRLCPHTECILHLDDCRLSFSECEDESVPGPSGVITMARCSPRDVFKKSMGRRVALGRALKDYVSAELRVQLMADYERQLLPKANS